MPRTRDQKEPNFNSDLAECPVESYPSQLYFIELLSYEFSISAAAQMNAFAAGPHRDMCLADLRGSAD